MSQEPTYPIIRGISGNLVDVTGRNLFKTVDTPLEEDDIYNNLGYSISTGAITIASAAETDFLLLSNPSGSGVSMYWRQLTMSNNKGNTPYPAVFKQYLTPTITTNGTAITPVPCTAGTSQIAVYKLPTISARGTLQRAWGYTNDLDQSVGGEIILPANTKWLITVTNTQTSTDHYLYLMWIEK